MTLDKDDKKEIANIVQNVIDKSVKPEFQTVNRKLDATMEMCAKNTEEITFLNDSFIELKDNSTEMGYTIERIETKLDSTIRRQDDASVKNAQLSRRVLKLEMKKN